ncbi:MAG: DUF4430 domain-containing protein [bacterium]|nr:DUF4430 domain-containing protein [bacterium]
MKVLHKVKKAGVQHWHVYMFGLSLIVIAGAAAVRDSQVREQLTSEHLREVELAYAKNAPPAEVLGAHLDNNSLTSIRQIGHKGQNVLQRLQENHVVIVEHTEDGTQIKAVDGAGISENARETTKTWSYTINGREATVSADRFVPHDGDVILWEYK